MKWLSNLPLYLKVPAYVGLAILGLIFFPVTIGVGLMYLANRRIKRKGLKTAVLVALFIPTAFVGVAEAYGLTHSSPPTAAVHSATPTPASNQAANSSPSTSQTDPAPVGANTSLGHRTKTSGCVISGALQDKTCTPGAIFDVTKDQICVSGYSSKVRDVPESEKAAVYAEYGIATHTTGQYEVDHLISLELGGSNDISNLWPEAASPTPGFHQKDVLENSLHAQVCSGQIDLKQAQAEIADNWLAAANGTYSATASQATQQSAAAPAPAPATGGVVKLSTTGICHAPGDAYYDRTTNFTAYPTMDACVAAGGRPSLK